MWPTLFLVWGDRLEDGWLAERAVNGVCAHVDFPAAIESLPAPPG